MIKEKYTDIRTANRLTRMDKTHYLSYDRIAVIYRVKPFDEASETLLLRVNSGVRLSLKLKKVKRTPRERTSFDFFTHDGERGNTTAF